MNMSVPSPTTTEPENVADETFEWSKIRIAAAIWLSITIFFWLMQNWHPLQNIPLYDDDVFVVLFFGSVTIIIYAVYESKVMARIRSKILIGSRKNAISPTEDMSKSKINDSLEIEGSAEMNDSIELEEPEVWWGWYYIFFGLFVILGRMFLADFVQP